MDSHWVLNSGDIMLSHKIQQIIVTGQFLLHPTI